MRTRAGRAAPSPSRRRRRISPTLRRAVRVGDLGCARRRRLWRGCAEPAADRSGDPHRGRRSGLAASAGRSAGGIGRYRSRGAARPPTPRQSWHLSRPHAARDPRRQPEPGEEEVESLPWVRSAAIERRLPGTPPRAAGRTPPPSRCGQHAGKQELIDREGAVIPVKDLTRFARLPTVVGDDAASRADRAHRACWRRTRACRPGDRRGAGRRPRAGTCGSTTRSTVLLPRDNRPRRGRGSPRRNGQRTCCSAISRASICGCRSLGAAPRRRGAPARQRRRRRPVASGKST